MTTTPRGKGAKLYWCNVRGGDGHEWFVVADCARRARRFFAKSVDAHEDDVTSLLVFILAPEVEAAEGWPTTRVLEACGVRYLVMRFGTQVVEWGGRFYRAPDIAPLDLAGGAMRMVH